MTGAEPRSLEERRLLDMLGLAARARKLVAGTAAVRMGVREGKVVLVLTAGDVAATQLAKLVPLLQARQVRNYSVVTRAELGRAVGRSPVGAVGITDPQFARGLEKFVAAPDAAPE